MSLVKVKPIERETWHNKKGKDVFSRPIVIEALVNVNTSKYATGLSDEDRKRLESITGYDLSPEYVPGKIHPFYATSTGAVKLEHKTTIFNTKNPLDEIKVGILKGSDLVANSLEDFEKGLAPYARFIIFDEEEELEVKASRAALKRKVIIEGAKLTKARKTEIVQILLNVSVKNQSSDFIDLKLDEAIDTVGAQEVLNLIERDKGRTTTHAMIIEGLHKNVLRKEGTGIYYLSDQLGYDMESTIDYFQDAKNQNLKTQLLEKINS